MAATMLGISERKLSVLVSVSDEISADTDTEI